MTGTASASHLDIYLQSAGEVYLDDLKLVVGSSPEVGQNYLQNGDFKSTLSPPWNTTANTAASSLSTTTIAPHGYLLVWADEEPGQNHLSRPDLHADFNLSLTGEAIGLYAPNGTNISLVTFTTQTNDVSQGRYTDANSAVCFMTNGTPRAANTLNAVPANRRHRLRTHRASILPRGPDRLSPVSAFRLARHPA